MAKPHVNKIPDKLMIKLRSSGFSFGEIGLCAGVTRQAISEKMRSIAPHLIDLDHYAENERQYYLNEEMMCLTLGGLLRDRAAMDLVNNSSVNIAALNASAKITETAIKLFTARRLIDGKSTQNAAHFSHHYRNADDRKPVFAYPPVTDLTTLPPHTIDVTPAAQHTPNTPLTLNETPVAYDATPINDTRPHAPSTPDFASVPQPAQHTHHDNNPHPI